MPVWLLWLTKLTIPSAGFGVGAMICTPDEPSLANRSRYRTSSGAVKPKNRYTRVSTRPRGDRVIRNRSSRAGLIALRCGYPLTADLPSGQREERGLQVGRERLAGDEPGPARREHLRDALLAVGDRVGVDPDPPLVQLLHPPRPGPGTQLAHHVLRRAAQPHDPARVQVLVDQRAGLALVDEAPGAQHPDLVCHPLHVAEDVTGEDDGTVPAHRRDQVQDLRAPGRVEGRGGLVEQQQPGVADERGGQAEP